MSGNRFPVFLWSSCGEFWSQDGLAEDSAWKSCGVTPVTNKTIRRYINGKSQTF
jgi:hypothetical protein